MNATATEAVTETKAETKKSVQLTGDFLIDTATKIKDLTKVKAINRADALLASEGETDFELGGLLLAINNQNWFEGHDSFDAFVSARFSMHPRKARYLMTTYKELVEKQVPWDIVKGLGWTRLRELTAKGVLTAENAQEWADKASKLSVLELIKLLKGSVVDEGSPSASKKDDIQTIKFKLKNDQVETVNTALAKAKAEIGTEFDNVGLEAISQAYLSGSTSMPVSLKAMMESAGAEEVLKTFDACFPDWTITVDPPEDKTEEA